MPRSCFSPALTLMQVSVPDSSEAAEKSIRETLAAHKDCLYVTYEHVFTVL